MKNRLHIIATVICMLGLVLSAATCMSIVLPNQPPCNHCPKSSPLSQDTPACCSVQQQPPAVVSSAEVVFPAYHQVAVAAAFAETLVSTALQPIDRRIVPPQLPPRIALRI